MNPDDFEQRLQRQPIRPIPGTWRAGILQAATETAGTGAIRKPGARLGWLESFRNRVASMLQPRPQAWMALAAIWIACFFLNIQMQKPSQDAHLPASEARATEFNFIEQRQILAELLDAAPSTSNAAEPPRQKEPRPRSERRPATAMA
jgi:hypothetical protein